jgi:predicted transcriptional regulator
VVIELTSEDQHRLSELAEAMQRSEADIAKETMHWFLNGKHQSIAEAVAEGDKDFERGDVLEHHEVVAQFTDVLRHA